MKPQDVPEVRLRFFPPLEPFQWRAGTGSLRAFCSGGGVNCGRRPRPPNPHPRRPLSRWCCLLPSSHHAHPTGRGGVVEVEWAGGRVRIAGPVDLATVVAVLGIVAGRR